MKLTCVRPCQMLLFNLRPSQSVLRHFNNRIHLRYNSDYSKAKSAREKQTSRSIHAILAQFIGCSVLGGVIGYTVKKTFLTPSDTEDGVITVVKPPRIHRNYEPVRFKDVESGLTLTLYHDRSSPQACQVRAYLDRHQLSYDLVEVANPDTAPGLRWTYKRQVPLLVCHDVGKDGFVQIHDAAVIIGVLESWRENQSESIDKLMQFFPFESEDKALQAHQPKDKYFVKTSQARDEEEKWRRWVDEKLIPLLAPNIYRTRKEAFEAARYFEEDGNWSIHFNPYTRWNALYRSGIRNYFLTKLDMAMGHRHGLNARESLYKHCNRWLEAMGKERKFMGGKEPDLADLAMYGALSSIEGTETFLDVLENTRIEDWYLRVKAAVTHRPQRDVESKQ